MQAISASHDGAIKMKQGDVVQIFREENDEWTLLGTAKVKSVTGNDVTYESLPSGLQRGDIIVTSERLLLQ